MTDQTEVQGTPPDGDTGDEPPVYDTQPGTPPPPDPLTDGEGGLDPGPPPGPVNFD